ncbi:MAG: helix-turn-helix domain-containing protein [Bryobacteraceae bacterium]
MSDDSSKNKTSARDRHTPISFGDVFNPRKMFVGIFLPEALVATDTISSTGKLVWGHLARRAGENGHCFPSKRDISKHVGIQERQVGRVLKELVGVRMIRAVPRTDRSGRSTSNEYEFLWHALLEPSLRGEGVTNDTLVRVAEDMDRVTPKTPPRVSSTPPLQERAKNHHQLKVELRKEKSVEQPTTAAFPPQNAFDSKKPADDDFLKTEYATPRDEIKAIAKAKLGRDLPLEDLRWILENLELQGVSDEEYVLEVRKHLGNLWKNPIGMLKSLAKGFRRKVKLADPPITKSELEDRNYQCPKCSSRKRGEGVHLVAGEFVPCECASDEFIERQRAKGLISSAKPMRHSPQCLPPRTASEFRVIKNGN